MGPHLAFVGGEDHNLRIPFLLALALSGYRVTAVSPGSGEAFARAGIEHAEFRFDRFASGVSELRALSRLRHVLAGLAPGLYLMPSMTRSDRRCARRPRKRVLARGGQAGSSPVPQKWMTRP